MINDSSVRQQPGKSPVWARCIILILVSVSFYSCTSDDAVIKDPPVITGLSTGSTHVGDTITVVGEGFDQGWDGLKVAFSGCGFTNSRSFRDAEPVSVSRDSVLVIVPDGAFSGGLRIQWDNPLSRSGPFDINVPPAASNIFDIDVSQSQGDVAKVFYSGSEYSFWLGEEGEASEYLLVIFSSGSPGSSSSGYEYFVDTGETFPVDTPGERLLAAGRAAGPETASLRHESLRKDIQSTMMEAGTLPRDFENRRMTEYLDLIGKGSSGNGKETVDKDLTTGLLDKAPQVVVFNVYSDWEGSTIDPGSFVQVSAVLAHEGEHTLLYLDEDTPESCISIAEADQLGEAFDTNIYQTDRSAFGNESDINSDGKVAILLSPVINRLTPAGTASTTGFIAGFFLPGDLIPAYMPAGSTNGMEIFYTMVPDPEGIYGNEYAKEPALEVIRGVLAHEFLHMIMFNYRVLQYGEGIAATYMAETWVNEGLAHIAEDLNGHEASNIGRSNLFLDDPGAVSLIHGGDELDERGAAFLFFRYLGDRFGEDVFRSIVQTREVGTRNIEAATGQPFFELFADWAAALYLDDLGITPDPRFEFTSIDLRGDFNPIPAAALHSGNPSVEGGVRPMGPEYIRVSLPMGTLEYFNVYSDPGSYMNIIMIRME